MGGGDKAYMMMNRHETADTARIATGGGDKAYMTMNRHKVVDKERRRRRQRRRILPVFIFVISGIHLQFLYHAIVVDAAFDFTSNTSRSAFTRQHRHIHTPHTNNNYHTPRSLYYRTCLSSVVQDENVNDDDCDDNETGTTTTPTNLSSSPMTNIVDRRSMLLGTSAKATTAATSAAMLMSLSLVSSPEIANAEITKDSINPLWAALPVAPYSRRKTIMKKITDGVYIFDQLIGIYYVHVPIRMTVCVINDGLFVYAPVAPTKECLQLLQQLIDTYGPIQTIVLPSVAVEHKVNAGPFARKFPHAEFYAVGKQYSFPLNLPSSFLGLPSWTKILPDSSSSNDISNMWNGQLEHEVLTVKPGIGSEFQDVAFYHKASNTLLLCDTIVAVDENPPSILVEEEEYVKALLFHARDSPLEIVDDTIENRRKGWRRIVLLFNFFFPSSANVDLGLKPLLRLDPSYKYGWGGWMPFEWISEEKEIQTFDAYKQNGLPTIFPIVQIILSRGNSGQETLRWVNKVKQWPFTRIIPQHLNAPIAISPKEFEDVFSFINEGRNIVRFCDDDVKFLREAEEGFLNFSVYKSNLGTLQGKKNCT